MAPSDEEIARARRKGEVARASEPRAKAVRYDPASRRITVELATEVAVSFGLAHLPELHDASPEDLQHLVLGPSGDSIELPARDVHISLGGLLLELLGATGWRRAIRTELNREAARVTSEAKAAAARANGAKGGRPRKTVT